MLRAIQAVGHLRNLLWLDALVNVQRYERPLKLLQFVSVGGIDRFADGQEGVTAVHDTVAIGIAQCQDQFAHAALDPVEGGFLSQHEDPDALDRHQGRIFEECLADALNHGAPKMTAPVRLRAARVDFHELSEFAGEIDYSDEALPQFCPLPKAGNWPASVFFSGDLECDRSAVNGMTTTHGGGRH